MRQLLLVVLMLTAVILNTSVSANYAHPKDAPMKYILIHGFISETIRDKVSDSSTLKLFSRHYWHQYWYHKADAHLYWDSGKRLAQNRANLLEQLNQVFLDGTCRDGCMFVTHSTGDLVLRDLLEQWRLKYLETYLRPEPEWEWLSHILAFRNTSMRIYGSIDIAGAGGGSELAEAAIKTVKDYHDSSRFTRWLLRTTDPKTKAILNTYQRVPTLSEMGILHDLVPAVARSTAIGNSAIPRLRVVGGGRFDNNSGLLGFLTSELLEQTLPGLDDGVIAAHSACGALQRAAYNSCFRDVKPNGLLYQDEISPASFFDKHFPVLMGDSYDHSDLLDGEGHGKITTDLLREGRDFDFYLRMEKPALRFVQSGGELFAWVENSDHIHISDVLINQLRKKN